MTDAPSTVLGLVLTHDDPGEVQRCVDALWAQTRRPDAVVVVDCGSRPAAAPAARGASPGWLEVLRLEDNVGPAGGHHAGLRHFLDRTDFGLAWVMDDDVAPDESCLELLMAADAPPGAVRWPRQDHTGDGATPGQFPGWFAVLLPRAVVADVGLPRAELFWWAEDTEYLQWRIPRRGHPVVTVEGARISHSGRATGQRPPWKVYYEVRNSIEYRARVQRLRHPIKLVRIAAVLLAGVLRQRQDRRAALRAYGAGMVDAARGRFGKRWPVP